MPQKKLKAFELDGMVATDELSLLAEYAGKVEKGQAIVEIGSYLGRSCAALVEGSRDDVKVYAVDPYESYQVMTPDGLPFNYSSVNRNIFINNIERLGFSDRVEQIELPAVEAGSQWGGKDIGLLWIDAKHDYDSVKADFAAWEAFVPVGGFVAFHDYQSERGVTSLVDSLLDRDEWINVNFLRMTVVLQRIAVKSAPTSKKKDKP